MIKEAIQHIQDITLDTVEDKGRIFTSRPMHPVMDSLPGTLNTHTLTSVVDYLALGERSGMRIHVVDHKTVRVVTPLNGNFAQRATLLEAKHDGESYPFGNYEPVDTFIVKLQAMFFPTDDRDRILALVGNLQDGEIRTTEDDGVTQTATVRAGVTRRGAEKVPNPVILRPYRTFSEVAQPESPFVFRMKSGGNMPICGLFEADGGAWRLDAVCGIRAWFENQLKDVPILA